MRLPALRSAALAFFFVFAATAFAENVTLQEGLNAYGGTTDTRITSFLPATNYGSSDVIPLERETQQSILIRFAIFAAEGGPVPDNATITSATLSLYKFWGPAATIKASRLKRSWNEMQATWNVAATGSSWQTAGAFGANDVEATADGEGSVGDAAADGCGVAPYPAACWLNINVTSGVQAFRSGTPNHGWKLAYVSGGNASDQKEFKSSEHPSSTLRPKLTVTYCAPPTAQLTATPSSGSAPLNVAFDASGSTDEGSAITNLRLQFGDGTPDANWSDKNQAQQHTYAANGTFSATLTATNACGTSAPVTRTITVSVGSSGPTAQLAATPQSGTAAPLTVTFNASGSSQGSAPIQSLKLVFGDNTADANWNDKNVAQQHTYTAAGTYTATLTVTDSNNLSHSDSKTIQVGPDDCSRSGLQLCLRFEPSPDTRFQVPDSHQVTMASVGGTTVTGYAHNKNGGNSADPNPPDGKARLSLVNFGRDGSSAMRFTTYAEDSEGNADWQRSELSFSTGETDGPQGAERWWTQSVYLPVDVSDTFGQPVPDFQMPPNTWNAAIFMQFHSNPPGDVPGKLFHMAVYNQGGTNPRRVFHARQIGDGDTEQYTYSVTGTGQIDGQCLHDNPVTNTWYDFVHHVKFSVNGGGFHEIWMRQADGQVKKVLSKHNISTLRYSNVPAYLKFGWYHSPVAGPTSVVIDRVRRGTTYEAIKPPGFPDTLPSVITPCADLD